MLATVIICIVVFIAIITGILFFPKIRIGKTLNIDSYWIISLLGLIILLIFGLGNINDIFCALTEDNAINPIKILVLFISMTVLSIFLDEAGFFKYLATVTLKRAKTSQSKLFLYLYVTVSVLTVFTSNDIIILSFTPFIVYFSKNAKINPVPYLAAEFVAANTWSMALIIGNPTNIYIASAYGINFIDYLKVMALPTVLSGIASFLLLFLLFRKQLNSPVCATETEDAKSLIKDKLNLTVGVILLGACTVMLAVSSYFNIEMWLISFGAFIVLVIFCIFSSILRKRKPTEFFSCLKRAPWQLVPFIISMFSIIIILKGQGVTEKISEFLGEDNAVYKYGALSFLTANVINNIPMSVLFCSIIEFTPTAAVNSAVYASVIGSNLGALFTPIGALAGIMWVSILSEHKIKYRYLDFIKTGIVVGLPSLAVCLLSLTLFI